MIFCHVQFKCCSKPHNIYWDAWGNYCYIFLDFFRFQWLKWQFEIFSLLEFLCWMDQIYILNFKKGITKWAWICIKQNMSHFEQLLYFCIHSRLSFYIFFLLCIVLDYLDKEIQHRLNSWESTNPDILLAWIDARLELCTL